MAEWKTPKLRDKLNDKKLYVASEESCLCITKNQWAVVAACGLQSNQEEADTRIILHAAHAAEEGYSAVVITADDTDSPLISPVPCSRNAERKTGLGILTSPSYARPWDTVSVLL